MLVLRKLLTFGELFVEILILLFNPLFGLFSGLGYIMEVYSYFTLSLFLLHYYIVNVHIGNFYCYSCCRFFSVLYYERFVFGICTQTWVPSFTMIITFICLQFSPSQYHWSSNYRTLMDINNTLWQFLVISPTYIYLLISLADWAIQWIMWSWFTLSCTKPWWGEWRWVTLCCTKFNSGLVKGKMHQSTYFCKSLWSFYHINPHCGMPMTLDIFLL